MEGVSHEAGALAGHLRLNKLIVLYDDNHISIDGDTALSFSDDVLKRFAAYGWATKRVDGHDPAQIAAALSFAMRSNKPTMIACRTIIGLRRAEQGRHRRGARLGSGRERGRGRQGALGWDEPPFTVPEDLLRALARRR